MENEDVRENLLNADAEAAEGYEARLGPEDRTIRKALRLMSPDAIFRFINYRQRTVSDYSLSAFYTNDEYDWCVYSVEGNVELHERLVFQRGPMDGRLVFELRHYLFSMLRLSLQRPLEEGKNPHETGALVMDATITVGEKSVSSSDPAQFLKTLFEDLPAEDGFTVDCSLNGVVREYFSTESDESGECEEAENGEQDGERKECDDAGDGVELLLQRVNEAFKSLKGEDADAEEQPLDGLIRRDAAWTGAGMLDMLEKYKRREHFEYKMVVYYPDAGEWNCAKILNGRDVYFESSSTESVTGLSPDGGWDVDTTDIWVEFDFKKHADIVEKLHELAKNTFEGYDLQNCEGLWMDAERPGCVCSNCWRCDSLQEVQDYLDKVNGILHPIMRDVTGDSDGCWVAPEFFGYARCVWTNEGFKIKGLML